MTSTAAPRVVFFVDGFNLYHSIKSAEQRFDGIPLKWLDLPALCDSTLHLIGGGARRTAIHYFTAFADYLREKDPGKFARHQLYVRALTARKVILHTGRFQRRQAWADDLNQFVTVFEEKETDVAIACACLGLAAADAFDVAVMLTGDSDFTPLVETFTQAYPDKQLRFAFPYDRVSKQLHRISPQSFKLSKESYRKHQFPHTLRLPSGKHIHIPPDWTS
ncbi:MAG: NYN domain-containing protein [Verrucomicrobia bacterium]|nr:NYN domain-containing protein [Verrucomicrobiota bacterium]MCH8527019.1 NYN domain-containing protein [Kiritimatiellia bacterium]